MSLARSPMDSDSKIGIKDTTSLETPVRRQRRQRMGEEGDLENPSMSSSSWVQVNGPGELANGPNEEDTP